MIFSSDYLYVQSDLLYLILFLGIIKCHNNKDIKWKRKDEKTLNKKLKEKDRKKNLVMEQFFCAKLFKSDE